MNRATVSVVIPVYNGAQWLPEAIESVLGQTRPAHQVIVVDDGSTDQSAAVARRYLPYIQLEQQPNAGCAQARNRGVSLASGEFLAFLDHNDYWEPNKLALQVGAIEQSPALEAVLGQLKQFCTETSVQPDGFAFDNDSEGAYHLDTLLIRRQAFERIGYFDPTLPLSNSIEWLWRARSLGLCLQMLPDVVAWRRIHGENMSIRDRPQVQAEYLRMIGKIRKLQKEAL